mmetsp:Transcript_9331/g.30909  ORF Transcript_9331/g.30909 Transcript_9331/m.30909 type:complete len:224 (-) Transcript_9331:635-1306(-)
MPRAAVRSVHGSSDLGGIIVAGPRQADAAEQLWLGGGKVGIDHDTIGCQPLQPPPCARRLFRLRLLRPLRLLRSRLHRPGRLPTSTPFLASQADLALPGSLHVHSCHQDPAALAVRHAHLPRPTSEGESDPSALTRLNQQIAERPEPSHRVPDATVVPAARVQLVWRVGIGQLDGLEKGEDGGGFGGRQPNVQVLVRKQGTMPRRPEARRALIAVRAERPVSQ